ncbi:tetratricopeptide repeat protein [Nocardia sp. NPDC004718]
MHHRLSGPLRAPDAHPHRALPGHPRLRSTRNALADTLRAGGRFEEAVKLFETMFEQTKRALGSDHPLADVVRDQLAAAEQVAETHRRHSTNPP